MSKIPKDLNALCAAARQQGDPSDEDRRAVLASIALKAGAGLGLAAGVSGIATESAASTAAPFATGSGVAGIASAGASGAAIAKGSLLSKALVWIAGGLGSAGALGVGAHQLYGPGDAPAAPQPTLAVRGVSSTSPAPDSASLEPRTEALFEKSSPPPAKKATPPETAAARSLEQETLALAAIQRALRDGRPAAALALLDEEKRIARGGVLRAERSAARVFALCDLGRANEARALAQRFLVSHANSPLSKRVRESCREEPGTSK